MIDVHKETVVSFREATKHVPPRRPGKPRDVSTIYKWASVGVNGVKLEFVQVGGGRVTSKEALGRFFNALTDKAVSQSEAISLSQSSEGTP